MHLRARRPLQARRQPAQALLAAVVAILPARVLMWPLAPAAAQSTLAVIDLDPAKTTIAYSLEGWPHHTQGTFRLRSGQIRIDAASGNMGGTIAIDAASGDSGHSVRDERMRSSVLEAGRFPIISFAPQQVISHGDPRAEFAAKVRGLMSLHGAQHEFTIDAMVRRDGNEITMRCSFMVPYVAWGLADPSILMFRVAKEVEVNVVTVGRLSFSGQPSTR